MTLGHSAEGGGASISNSPINLTINIHVHTETIIADEGIFLQKMKRVIGGLLGQEQHRTLNITPDTSEDDIQRGLIRTIENG